MIHTSTNNTERIALFPGSFHPFTAGHADIVARGLELFDKVVIAIGLNPEKPAADAAARVNAIAALYRSEPRVEIVSYSCLTAEFARSCGARFILRGVRSVKDFEYERDMADVNHQISGIESVILFSRPELAAVSSSLVRELESYGHDVSQFLAKEYNK